MIFKQVEKNRSCCGQQTLKIFIKHWGKISLMAVFLEIIRRFFKKFEYLGQFLREWWSIKKSLKNTFFTNFWKPIFDLVWPPMASSELCSQTYIPYVTFYVFLSILTFFWAVLLTFYLMWPPEICIWPLWPLKPIWCRFVYMYINNDLL